MATPQSRHVLTCRGRIDRDSPVAIDELPAGGGDGPHPGQKEPVIRIIFISHNQNYKSEAMALIPSLYERNQ